MKLRNKKTGQKGNFIINKDHFECVDLDYVPEYRNLAELNAEWEDASEESKEYWWIDTGSIPMVRKSNNPILSTAEDIDKEIGNYFGSEEEAEKAVEKLKAWRRLKDKGLEIKGWEFKGITPDMKHNFLNIKAEIPYTLENMKDLDLLFGGEE